MSKDATPDEINKALQKATDAFAVVKEYSGQKKGEFLRAIAEEIEALGQTLVATVMRETALPEGRVMGERGRTTGHCRMFAALVEEGSWREVRIDTAQPERAPVPKPDLRKMMIPVGPVVVFGASNFPLAYSTAGGDTISALAAGCPVIVKAHPAHAETSELVAQAIFKAMARTGMPEGYFQHLHGASFEVGKALVEHPQTKSVGFTGSFAGGKALFDIASRRAEPIPVFAEMSSINPVIVLPTTLKRDAAKTAEKLVPSITLNVGQFCTDPGLILGIDNEALGQFASALGTEIKKVLPGTMLHQGIADNYSKKLKQTLDQTGVTVEGQSDVAAAANQGKALVASVRASEFISNPLLAEEIFGPFSLLIRCQDKEELLTVARSLHGQLTTTIIGDEQEISEHPELISILSEKTGRLIINGVPTGVEVCAAQQHGGPFPSTTDSRFTSVGPDAIRRFVRPLAFQNFPDSLLPQELKNSNPLGIWRTKDGVLGKH